MKHILKNIIKSSQMQEGASWTRRRYTANEVVVKAGELGNSLFFVEQGELRVTGKVELDGNKTIQPGISELTAGTIFGESCLHESLPRIATVTTIGDACLLEINGERLSVYLDDNPIQGYLFYKELFGVLIGRLKSTNHIVERTMAWGLKAHGIEQHL